MPVQKTISEKEREKALKRILATEKADLTGTLLGASITVTAICVFAGMLDYMGSVSLPFEWIDYVIFGILALIGPYGFYVSSKERHVREIETRLPDFLRDVAEAGRFGMTLADAIVVASSGRYGRLTPEIKKMSAQIEWGVPASEAIRLFSERVKTPLVTRMASIIMKANDAGGNVADVLTMVSHDAKETILTQEERGVTMQTYVLVVYIAYFVFIATVLILQGQFLPKMEDAGQQVSDAAVEMGAGDIAGVSINVDIIPTVSFIFLLSVVVHAVGDGLLAGVIQKGSIPIGMRHSFIMLLMGFITLRILFG
ncbi:MAG: type II secretion system F family protein [Thermoplasmata archaeon]|jgi:flagellar protein FlaJ|nr:type II secretion system F family protein [Thermoplasmata archaeon]